jgi:proteasome lid subunit RPN8/RPN11
VKVLRIRRHAYEAMLQHLRAVYPEEGCGLLGGTGDEACRHIAVPNALRSPAAFRMAPAAQIAAFMMLEDAGERPLAFYHSHPQGPALPSRRDIVEAAYPDVVMLIVALPYAERPDVRAFRIGGETFVPVAWQIV